MTDILCKSRAIALTALDTIATSMKGTQQAAVLAVKAWVQENVMTGLSQEELDKIFCTETEGQRKAREWRDRGSRKVNDEWVSTEPEDGTEWKCVWNGKTKRWEPPFPPPLIQKRGEV
jgi:hypothetical protein